MKIQGPPGPPPTTPFIVGELSKNWQNGHACAPTPLLCQQFELMINHNVQRGYELHSFEIHRFSPGPGLMNETLIAVFRRVVPS